MTPIIISRQDIAQVIDLSVNYRTEQLDPRIRRAIDMDLSRLMGDRFLYYFLSFFNDAGTFSPEAPQYIKDLYEGSVYNVNGKPSRNPGIKPVIACYVAARIAKDPLAYTPTGAMLKNNDFSDRPSQSSLDRVSTTHANEALAYWEKVEVFIRTNAESFKDYYVTGCGCETSRNGGRPRTVGIKRDEYYG